MPLWNNSPGVGYSNVSSAALAFEPNIKTRGGLVVGLEDLNSALASLPNPAPVSNERRIPEQAGSIDSA
jgi:hypothetical protein